MMARELVPLIPSQRRHLGLADIRRLPAARMEGTAGRRLER